MTDTARLWLALIDSWARSLRARNLSRKTIDIYATAAGHLVTHLPDGLGPDQLRREHVESFMEDFAAGLHPPSATGKPRSASFASQTYRALQQWCAWLVEEEEIEADPMGRMQAPVVPEKPVPVLTDDQLRALLATCSGRRLVDRRDTALIRLLIDTGGRLSEISNLTVADVDLDGQVCRVLGKGRRERTLPFGVRTADALDRYLRARRADKHRDEPRLWVGEKGKGPLTSSGVYQVVKRRGRLIGVPDLHPHQFRHTAAHRWLDAGGSEGDLMQIAGWKSRSMLQRYGSSVAAKRALDAHRRLGLGDQI